MRNSAYANRGMDFEKKIIAVCDYYSEQGRAVIHKVPTDWIVYRSQGVNSAFPKKKSIVDFLGAAEFTPIAIETKRVCTSAIPFSNIPEHQWEFFERWRFHGLGYFLIWFKTVNKAFLIDSVKFRECRDTIGRKSAPVGWFEENAVKLDDDLDFLKYIIKEGK